MGDLATKIPLRQKQKRTESERRARRGDGEAQEKAKSHQGRTAETRTKPAASLQRKAEAGPSTQGEENKATRVAGAKRRGGQTRNKERPKGGTNHGEPQEGPDEGTGPPKERATKESPKAQNTYTASGRGSAASSRDARPRWVIMEISRVARASTAERCGSSVGACWRKNGNTSAPSRPRASTTKGTSSACGTSREGSASASAPPFRSRPYQRCEPNDERWPRPLSPRWRTRRRRTRARRRRPGSRHQAALA